MTTHTDLIARLREMAGRLRLEAADALEALEQQVAALTKERDEIAGELMEFFGAPVSRSLRAEIVTLQSDNERLTNERNDLLILLDNWKTSQGVTEDQLVSAQARESKLRELWEVVEKEYFARLKEQDEEAAKFEAEKDMYGWNFHKGLRGGLVEFHIYMTKIVKALALPTDDSALMERLKQERDRICNMASLNLSERQRDAIRSMK